MVRYRTFQLRSRQRDRWRRCGRGVSPAFREFLALALGEILPSWIRELRRDEHHCELDDEPSFGEGGSLVLALRARLLGGERKGGRRLPQVLVPPAYA